MRQPQDRQRRVFGLGLTLGRRVIDVAESVATMHEGGIARGMQQGRGAAGKHGDVDTRDLAELEGVGDGVFESDIAGGDGQPDHFVVRIVERHQQGQRVVDARIGINQKGNALGHEPIMRCHARRARARST